MKKIFTLFLVLLSASVIGQDKQAKKILDQVSDVYDDYQSIEIQIDMTVAFPDAETRTADVTVVQKGEKFVFTHPDQTMYCDGVDLWLYIPSQNEVQINDYEIDEESDYMISPKDLLKQYKSGKYEYHLLHKTKTTAAIEFKPINRDSEYAKYHISLDTKGKQIKKVIAFGKDGSRVTLEVTDILPNQSYSDTYFNFDIKKYPDVYVEDLRL
ncbi:MAG: outer membrane lipoprotein carrier protein [Saprospiraceae bacterium]|jgi:outer membrane lipoprotein carrier protein